MLGRDSGKGILGRGMDKARLQDVLSVLRAGGGGQPKPCWGPTREATEERGAEAGGKEGQVEARWWATPGSWREDSKEPGWDGTGRPS